MKDIFIKIFTAVTYIAMVLVNFLANSLPINNRSTGDISDAYPNIFAPAGLTFSIWGLIYLLLAGYVIYQFVGIKKRNNTNIEKLCKKINLLFIMTSLANISWIFAWHYDFISLSVLIMVILLILLIRIVDTLRVEQLTTQEKICISLPFDVYFGWITIATIANITVFLVSIGWNGFGLVDYVWATIILLVGALIGILRIIKDKSIAYGLVLIWAYFGILLKHVSTAGFNGQYPGVIMTVSICMCLFGFFIGRAYYRQ